MKKLIYILTGMVFILFAASCEKDLEPYDAPDCHLNFIYLSYAGDKILTTEDVKKDKSADYNLTSYSFVYSGDAQRDTLWFKIGTMGFLSDVDRPLALQQLPAGDTLEDAQPGVHYVAFDDPQLADFYRVPAHCDTLSIPVILLRDPSLDTKTVELKFGFKDNGFFKPGYDMFSTRIIRLTAEYVQPSNWPEAMFGKWGPEKHRLMIEWTEEKWDEEYIKKIYEDYPYVEFIGAWLYYKLEEENAKRIKAGKDVYREADDSEVKFVIYRN